MSSVLSHGDTLNYSFKRIEIEEMQEIICSMIETLVREEVLYENIDISADKQDRERKAFYRLVRRLKARFPRWPICLLLDGLFAGGPTFYICQFFFNS